MKPLSVRSPRFAAILCLAFGAAACDEQPLESGDDDVELTEWQVAQFEAVNDAGVVAATARRDSINLSTAETVHQARPATWTQAGGLVVLPPPNQVVEAGAVDINEAGHLVALTNDDGVDYAFLWDGDSWQALGAFRPTALDENDNVVGYVWDAEDFAFTPVVHVAGSTGFSLLAGTPDVDVCEEEPSALPLDISSAGIVGTTFQRVEALEWVTTSDANLLFVYDDCQTAEESTAEAIDNDGNIVGWSGERGMAYIREPGDAPLGLGALPGAPASGWAVSCAYDIAGGWIAGTANSENGWRAVRWNADREIEDMGTGQPIAINAHGMMAGWYGPYADAIVWLADGTRIEFPFDPPPGAPARTTSASQSIPC